MVTAAGAVAIGWAAGAWLAALCVLLIVASAHLPVIVVAWALLAAVSGQDRALRTVSAAMLLGAAALFHHTVGTTHLGDLQWAPLSYAARGGWLTPTASLLVAGIVLGGLVGPLHSAANVGHEALHSLAATYLLLRVCYLFVRAPAAGWAAAMAAGVVAVIAARSRRPALAHGALGALGAGAGAFGPASVHGPLGAIAALAGGRLGAWTVGGLPGSAVGITLAGILAAGGTYPIRADPWLAWAHLLLPGLALIAIWPLAASAIRYGPGGATPYGPGGAWVLGLIGLAMAPLVIPAMLDRPLLAVFGEVGARRMYRSWLLRGPWLPFAAAGAWTLIAMLSRRGERRAP